MDPFHANLLLLQCQRLSAPPRPFDCAIRLITSSAAGGGVGTANAAAADTGGNGIGTKGDPPPPHHLLLFAHCHIIGARSGPLRAQLDQSPLVPSSQLLFQAPFEAQTLSAAGALGPELRELKLDLSALENAGGGGGGGRGGGFEEPFKQFLAFLYGESLPSASSSGHPNGCDEQLLLLAKIFAVPDLEMAIRSSLLSRLLANPSIGQLSPPLPPSSSCPSTAGSSQITNGQFQPPPPASSSSSSSSSAVPLSSQTLASLAPMFASSAGTIPTGDGTLPLYAAYLQLQTLLGQSMMGGPTTLPPSAADSIGAAPSCMFGQQPFQQQQSRPSSDSSPPPPSSIGTVQSQQFGGLLHHQFPPLPFSSCSSSSMGVVHRESVSSGSGSSSLPSTECPTGNNTEMLVPSNDKEGWCRNKKYIQIVKKGYRCLLCNKVYGRYNSVSYHVTIYHRNPPIRCEEQGCQFTTREARYIHFHKYYRHQIALPESIDLASRLCPLVGCKHVSKSPAMLDKHVQRHVADCLKNGIYQCQMRNNGNRDESQLLGGGGTSSSSGNGQCQFNANSHELMYAHLLGCHSATTAAQPAVKSATKLEEMEKAKSKSVESITGRKLVSASAPTTPPTPNSGARFPCEDCNFRARTLTALEQHRMQKHDGHLAAGGVGPISPDAIEGNGVVPHFPVLPSLGPSALNGIFSGLFPAFASLPSSPISPVTGGGGGGLFPSIPSFMDQHQQQHQQQNAQQLLLAQLFAAHKLASAFLSSSSPEAQQPQPQPSSTAPNGNETKLF